MTATCGAAYAPGHYPYVCDLPTGHAGDHEDHTSDAPHTLAWAAEDGEPVVHASYNSRTGQWDPIP